jgi:hypothetical protein
MNQTTSCKGRAISFRGGAESIAASASSWALPATVPNSLRTLSTSVWMARLTDLPPAADPGHELGGRALDLRPRLLHRLVDRRQDLGRDVARYPPGADRHVRLLEKLALEQGFEVGLIELPAFGQRIGHARDRRHFASTKAAAFTRSSSTSFSLCTCC